MINPIAFPTGIRIIVAGMLAVLVAGAASLAAFLMLDEDDDSDDAAARVIRQFLGTFQSPDTDLSVRIAALPDEFPDDVTPYRGGTLIAAVRASSSQGLAIVAVYETDERPSEALRSFIARMPSDWEVTSSTQTEDTSGVQFEDGLRGVIVTVDTASGDPGDAPYILTLSVFDPSAAVEPLAEDEPFVAGESLALPTDFPLDLVPIYDDATVIGTTFARVEGGTLYELRFITPDAQEDVIAFYERALADSGWDVDPPIEDASSIELAFGDSSRRNSFGAVFTGVFLREISLTEVAVQLSLADADR